MKRLWWLALLAPCLALPFAPGCSRVKPVWDDEPGSPRVVVTIAPLHSFVRGVAGDRAAIKCLCTTTGPHDYTTDYRDSRVMNEADVVFSVGLDLDDTFTEALHRMSRRGDKLPLVKLGEKLQSRGMVRKMRPHKHAPVKDGDEAPHHHGEYDPHVWLGLDEAVVMVGVIRDTLAGIDPDHADDYKKNAAAYVERLQKLKADGVKRFEKKKVKRLVSFHDAFEYFAKTFGLRIADVIELAPGNPPSSNHLVNLEKLCRDEKDPIGAITVEPQYPDSTSALQLQKALKARGIQIDLVSIDPLETADRKELKAEGADWYVTRMRQNVEALDKVLK